MTMRKGFPRFTEGAGAPRQARAARDPRGGKRGIGISDLPGSGIGGKDHFVRKAGLRILKEFAGCTSNFETLSKEHFLLGNILQNLLPTLKYCSDRWIRHWELRPECGSDGRGASVRFRAGMPYPSHRTDALTLPTTITCV